MHPVAKKIDGRGVKPGTKRGGYRSKKESRLELIPSPKNKAVLKYKVKPKDREDVVTMIAEGITHRKIADIMGVSYDTLVKYFDKELTQGLAMKNTKVTAQLFKLCMKGNFHAIQWWQKCRGYKWREGGGAPTGPPSNTDLDLSKYTMEELVSLKRLLDKGKKEQAEVVEAEFEPA